jgi:uncharacterized protein YjbI with pentapeptide repeats
MFYLMIFRFCWNLYFTRHASEFSIADLSGTKFTGANLSGANFAAAIYLTFEQLSAAIIDEKTVLPDDLKPRSDELLKISLANKASAQKNAKSAGGSK